MICFGKACIRGTRIWVSLILENLADGASEFMLDENLEPGLAQDLDCRVARFTLRSNGSRTPPRMAGVMSVTVKLDLLGALLEEAKANGLLESKRLAELLSNELRRERARKQFGRMLEDVRNQPGEPMSLEEIQVEVNAVREQRRREGGR